MSAPASSSTVPHGALQQYMRPPQHIGMQTLDRSAFDATVPVLSIVVEASKIGNLRPHPALRDAVLDLPKVKPIINSPQEEKGIKYVRLHFSEEEQLPEEVRELIKEESLSLRKETVKIGYENWNTSEILSAVLPTTTSDDIPSSFTSTGHIAHMNLREEWLPYRYLIGQVILDKNPGLRTVVNKLDTIHAQYRYFDMEVIAGEKDYITTLNESNCTFTFDFSRVYWNSRLHHEHERLIALFPTGSLIADVMAGVGPFAVPAAKRGSYVLGNDLNPESVVWMRENRVKNHVEENLRIFEMDGAAFIRSAAVEAWERPFVATVPKAEQRKRAKDARRAREHKGEKASEPPSPTSTVTSALASLTTGAMTTVTKIAEAVLSSTTDATSSTENAATAETATASSTTKDVAEQPKLPEPPRIIQHFIMNLPDSALTFLGAYEGCFTPLLSIPSFVQQYGEKGEGSGDQQLVMPMVHVYCFTREVVREKAEPDILTRASQYLSYDLTSECDSYNLYLVRSVAPNKDMYCLSFRLPREVAFRPL